MAAPLLARSRRRHAVPRVHLRRGVRHDPRGRRRPDALGRGDAVARPLGQRRAQGRTRTSASSSWWPACATVLLAVVSIVLGITFKGQNVAYMVGLAFAIAASANFPALVLSIFWKRLTTAGAQASMIVGTVSTLLLIYLSPTIQIDILKHAEAWFPLRNPGIVTIPLSFAVAIVVSLVRPVAAEARRFAELERQLHLGVE